MPTNNKPLSVYIIGFLLSLVIPIVSGVVPRQVAVNVHDVEIVQLKKDVEVLKNQNRELLTKTSEFKIEINYHTEILNDLKKEVGELRKDIGSLRR